MKNVFITLGFIVSLTTALSYSAGRPAFYIPLASGPQHTIVHGRVVRAAPQPQRMAEQPQPAVNNQPSHCERLVASLRKCYAKVCCLE